MPGGRPTKYNEDLVDLICGLISEGKSLVQICSLKSMPSQGRVYAWLEKYPEFQEKYEKARLRQAEHNAHKIQAIADALMEGGVDPGAARVAIDAYKWTASKLLPKKYGDKFLEQQNTTNNIFVIPPKKKDEQEWIETIEGEVEDE